MRGDTPSVRRLAEWDHDRLLGLAEEYGTPLYVLDRDRVRANYQRVTTAFPDAEILYAAKAHTGQAVLRTLVDAGAPIECAARGELKRAIQAGADPDRLQYTAVNPPATDLEYAVALGEDHDGFTITAGAQDTIDRLIDQGYQGRLAIRVNPGIGTGHHEKVATGKDAKFGIPYEQAPRVARKVGEDTPLELVGLHAHMGSGVLHDDLKRHTEAITKMADLARSVGELDFLDLGGGFGVPYREDVPPLEMEQVSTQVRSAIGEIDATIKFEPGRYVVADAELILTRVNTIKETPTTTVVGVDASLATLLRPAMFDAYHPIRNISAPTRTPMPVSVGGPCCTSADVFATDRPIAEPQRGEILAIGNAGAYGYELANQFHSQPRPAEVSLAGELLRRRETLADVTRLEEVDRNG